MMTSVGIVSFHEVNSCNQALLENLQLYRGEEEHHCAQADWVVVQVEICGGSAGLQPGETTVC